MNETIIRNKKIIKILFHFILFEFILDCRLLLLVSYFFLVNDFIILRVFQHEIKNCTIFLSFAFFNVFCEFIIFHCKQEQSWFS